MNGIFSFAIFDQLASEILIARDPFGTKPLYYYLSDENFYFSSEIKALNKLGGWDKTIDLEAINNYLAFLWSPGKKTPFSNIKKLLPGHFLRVNISTFKSQYEQYFKLVYKEASSPAFSEEDWISRLDRHMTDAVERQLMSDVPIGFFVSGGLDSCLIAAIAQRLSGKKKICAFTINSGTMEADGFVNDLDYATMFSKKMNIDLHVIDAKIDILSDFDKMIWHLEEPLADPASISVLRISEHARSMGIKVLLGGTGADELFSGYRRHQALFYYHLMSRLPKPFLSFLKKIANSQVSTRPIYRRIRRLVNDFDKPFNEVIAGYFMWISQPRLFALFNQSSKRVLRGYSPIQYFLSELDKLDGDTSDINKSLYLETKGYLPDHNLNYLDKMSMAVGIECRVPYLDLDLANFSSTIPSDLKLKGLTTKYILRKLAMRYLPKEIISRPKTGFSSPVRKWIKEDMNDFVNERLSFDRINKQSIFDPKEVERLILENKEGKIDASYTIWGLLAMQSWLVQFF